MTHLETYEEKLKAAGEIAKQDELTAEDVERMTALESEAAEAKAAHDREAAALAARTRIAAGLDALDTPPTTETFSSTVGLTPLIEGPAHESALDDPSFGYPSFAQFAQDVFASGPGETPSTDRLRIAAAATGMGQTIGHDGGFLVPPTFSTTIWDGMRTAIDNLLARTDQYTVEGESLTIPANAETSRANGSRYGGVRGYWLAEAAQITASAPTMRQMKLEPQELAVLVYVTDKLLRNSPVALEQYLTRAATEEILFMSGDAIVNGTGAGQPVGIVGAGGTVDVAKETGQAGSTIVKENIDKMWARLHPKAWANAVWFYNQTCLPQLQNLTLDVGTGGAPVFLPPGGISGAPYSTIYGRPAIPVEYCQALGTSGDIILGDLGAYATGTQGGVNQAASMHLRFDYAETAFRFMWALDGQPWLASAITPYKGGSSNTLAPFVTLADRS